MGRAQSPNHETGGTKTKRHSEYTGGDCAGSISDEAIRHVIEQLTGRDRDPEAPPAADTKALEPGKLTVPPSAKPTRRLPGIRPRPVGSRGPK